MMQMFHSGISVTVGEWTWRRFNYMFECMPKIAVLHSFVTSFDYEGGKGLLPWKRKLESNMKDKHIWKTQWEKSTYK